jgi:hypothetical protein
MWINKQDPLFPYEQQQLFHPCLDTVPYRFRVGLGSLITIACLGGSENDMGLRLASPTLEFSFRGS